MYIRELYLVRNTMCNHASHRWCREHTRRMLKRGPDKRVWQFTAFDCQGEDIKNLLNIDARFVSCGIRKEPVSEDRNEVEGLLIFNSPLSICAVKSIIALAYSKPVYCYASLDCIRIRCMWLERYCVHVYRSGRKYRCDGVTDASDSFDESQLDCSPYCEECCYEEDALALG